MCYESVDWRSTMKSRNLILLLVIACIGGVAFFFACQYTYELKVAKLSAKAREAFAEALNQELKSRNIEGKLTFSLDAKTVVAEVPDSVCLEDSLGKYWLPMDRDKDRMNITDNVNLRFLHSYVFFKKPIKPDSLNAVWGECLLKSKISAKPALCISVMNRQGDVKSQQTSQSEWCSLSHSVFTVTIGYACEIEVMGYLYYSIWHLMYVEIVFYFFLLIVSIYGIYRIGLVVQDKLMSMRQRLILRVKEVDATPIRSYLLRENVIFYAEQSIIEKDGVPHKLQPQSCQLLELFLKEKETGYILDDDLINNSLWPDGSGNIDRIYQAITRLRTIISKIDSSMEIKKGSGTYQLLL